MRRTKHPEQFQGRRKKNHYFEGWYYKQVSADQNQAIAFIPGISLNSDDPHAFIQVFWTQNALSEDPILSTYYFRFDQTEFSYQDQPFMIRIADNTFSLNQVKVNLSQNDFALSGTLSFQKLTPIVCSKWQPTIMGYFAYFPFMECNHGVISMSHQIKGTIKINGEPLPFDKGKGYIEKDWGKSFPTAYVWLQANHFSNSNMSLMASVAQIPFLFRTFKGFIINLTVDEHEFRFATYNRAKLRKFISGKSTVLLRVKRKGYTLEIRGRSDRDIELAAPKDGVMDHAIREGISATIAFTLKDRQGAIVYEDESASAGLEIVTKLAKR